MDYNMDNYTDFWTEMTPTTKEVSRIVLYRDLQLIVLWSLFISILIGNGAVLFALYTVRHKKSRMNFFVMNLAISDIIVGFFEVLVQLIHRGYTGTWETGNIACKLVKYIQAASLTASSCQLVALSVDRYLAIIYPMNFSGRSRRAHMMAAAAWITPFITSITSLHIFEIREHGEGTQCWMILENENLKLKLYTIYVMCILFFIPLVVILFCYCSIIITIWKKSKMMGPNIKPASNKKGNNYDNLKADEGSRSHRASSRGLIPKAKVKTIYITLSIVIAFVLCWSPFIFTYLLAAFQVIQPSAKLMAVIANLPAINSAVNPLIYGIFSTNLCRELKRIPVINWFAGVLPCCTARKKAEPGFTRAMYTRTENTNMDYSVTTCEQDSERIKLGQTSK
ncbi:cardioacceleratory peptide receptor-like [Antedon mediterranea]|uniref:cardioacceleratory peptide receptor-like n=1 Tax=Antedon mediterranea TaxID=105859 RepID=UPI003AF9D1AA